jgi:hypothetical protein
VAIQDSVVRRGLICILSSLLFAMTAGANGLAHAAPQSLPPTFNVNVTYDAVANPPLDSGPCEIAANDGICTLRAAIMKANHYAPGGATINLPAGAYVLSRPATNGDDETGGDLNLLQTMTINGAGAAGTIIDASGITPTTRVMSIEGQGIRIISVTLQGGDATGAAYGGGIIVRTNGDLFLYNSRVISNAATANGGGIFNDGGALTVTTDLVSHNMAGSNGGGIDSVGGDTLLVQDTLSSNSSFYGGGVENGVNSFLILLYSTLNGNSAFTGGGIYNAGRLQVRTSTISNNSALVSGGGMYNDTIGPCGNCYAQVGQSTLAGNRADAAKGGGLGGGLFNYITSTIALENTLLDGNVRSSNGPDIFDDCAGQVFSEDYNLISHTAGCSVTLNSHDLPDVPGLTGPLQNNGGLTFTNALLPGSPAIDAIPNHANSCGYTFNFDQRGRPRPAFGAHSFQCDIGAFELQQTLDLPLLRK